MRLPARPLNPTLVAGFCLVTGILLGALVGPLVSPYSPTGQVLARANQPPGPDHWFGTDPLGRDLFTRTLYGARISLGVALAVVCLNLGVGLPYGFAAGWFGGRVDTIMMGILEVLYGIPILLYVIFFLLVVGPGPAGIFLTLGLAYWLDLARQVRGQVLILKEAEFVLAARALGAGPWHILRKHLFPNMRGPLLVTITLQVPRAVFLEAFLSYLGLGVTAPLASCGVLLAEGVNNLRSYPWQVFFPAAVICLTTLGFNLLGEGLREWVEGKWPGAM